MMKWTPRPGSSACRAWRGDCARDRLEPLQHGRMELRGRGLRRIFASICRGIAQVAPPSPPPLLRDMWKSIIFTLLLPSGELYITESIKASSGRAEGATVLDEFAFALGHLKGRKCSVRSSWNWNDNGKQCLKTVCGITLRGGVFLTSSGSHHPTC